MPSKPLYQASNLTIDYDLSRGKYVLRRDNNTVGREYDERAAQHLITNLRTSIESDRRFKQTHLHITTNAQKHLESIIQNP